MLTEKQLTYDRKEEIENFKLIFVFLDIFSELS